MISLGEKLFEEEDRPTGSKIISQDKTNGLVERESSWTGEIKGFGSFPSGKATGSGRSLIHDNGITISSWQGVFTTEEDGQEVTFKGRDINKNGKFIVLRTYFTGSERVKWIDGLVCILQGEFDVNNNCFKSVGYEWRTQQ
jgi:hypothetical protein